MKGWEIGTETQAGLDRLGLAEVDSVAERIKQVQLRGSPECFRDAGTPGGVVLLGKLGMEFDDALEGDLKPRAGRAVAVVLGEMEHQAVAGDLHVEGGGGVEAVLPIEMEAGVVEVKLTGLLDGEDAQDGDDLLGARAHGGSVRLESSLQKLRSAKAGPSTPFDAKNASNSAQDDSLFPGLPSVTSPDGRSASSGFHRRSG